MKLNPFSRSAFSQVDLLIGLVCLVWLATLSMPCMIQWRGQARQDSCANKLRELALAAHNYYDAYRRLPPATLGFEKVVDADAWANREDSEQYWHHVQNSSSLLLTAPYMELTETWKKAHPIASNCQQTLRDYNRNADTTFGWQGDISGMEEISRIFVDKLLCPEDNLQATVEVDPVVAIIATQPCLPFEQQDMESIDACRDIAIRLWETRMDQLGLTNYAACLGVCGQAYGDDPELRRWAGSMSPRGVVRFASITDGTSLTLMYGETLGEIVDGQRLSAMSWLWGGGARILGHWPMNADRHPDDAGISMIGDATNSSGAGFGSKHPDGILFAICDGSVRVLKRDIDRDTWYRLAGAADGMIAEGF
jgi:hypothetical protein